MLKKLILIVACFTATYSADIGKSLSISIKGIGSPLSKSGNFDSSCKLGLKKKRLYSESVVYAGIEAKADDDIDYQYGGNSNLALFFGGESKERCTGFLNFSAFKNTKKRIDNQEELTIGGGVALVGTSYKKYTLKYSFGFGGKSLRSEGEQGTLLSRQNSPILDNRLKFKAPFSSKNVQLSLSCRELQSLKERDDFQLFWKVQTLLKVNKALSLKASYGLDYDNTQLDEQWSDKVSVGLTADLLK